MPSAVVVWDVGMSVAIDFPLRRRIISSSEMAFSASVLLVTTISPDSRDARLSKIVF